MSAVTEKPTAAAGRLTQILNLQQAADFLGLPLTTLRYWSARPPEGFPGIVRSGKVKYIRAAELERWALGNAAPILPVQPPPIAPERMPKRRGPGRPRKQPTAEV